MHWRSFSLDTFIPQFPQYLNYNFGVFENYIDSFYDPNKEIFIRPLETRGKVKGDRGEFVTTVTDNLVVRNQWTNLFDNFTTADGDYYSMIIKPAIEPRDPCTYDIDTSTWDFPYEPAGYKVIDVNKPYYKITNETPYYLNNENLSQVVGFYFDPSLVGLNDFQILMDPCSGMTFDVDPSFAGSAYIEFIAVDYDASWGSTWTQYKYGVDDSSAGMTGTMTYNPSLSDSITMADDVGGLTAGTTVGDLRGKTYEELWNEMLFPTVSAYIGTLNSADLTGISTSTLEIGTFISPSVSGIYDPGLIKNGDDSNGPNLTGNASSYIFRLPNGGQDGIYTASGNTQLHLFTGYNLDFGTNRWQVQIDYDEGTGVYYDNKGNPVTNLDAQRVAGTSSDYSSVITGRRYTWYGAGAVGSTPTNSTQVRALSDKMFLSSSNTGTFDISIPSSTPEVYFFIPTGKTVTVQYVESSFADVTGSFSSSAISVDDAGGTAQSYESWSTTIGGGGYPASATYRVTIT